MNLSRRSRAARKSGTSLVELLVVCMLMGFAMASVLQMIFAMTLSATRVTNRADSIQALNWYASYLGPDVRQSTSIKVSSDSTQVELTIPIYVNEFPQSLSTVTYKIIPNAGYEKEFQMVRIANGQSTTILTGIIGPSDKNDITGNTVKTFTYKYNASGFPGVGVDIDLKRPQVPSGANATAIQGLGIHNEWYSRSVLYSGAI